MSRAQRRTSRRTRTTACRCRGPARRQTRAGRPARWTGLLAAGLLLGTMTYALAEEYVLTTYYPSPRGVYNELRTTGTTLLALQTGGKVGIGPNAITNAPTASLLNVGEQGISNTAIYGKGTVIGVSGTTDSATGTGVRGEAQGATSAKGVHGVADADTGIGVLGKSNAGTGVFGESTTGGIGVRGKSTSGHAGYFEGRLYVSGNVGIGTADPGEKLVVKTTRDNDGISIKGDVGESSHLRFWEGSVQNMLLSYDGAHNSGTLAVGTLRFATAPPGPFQERMRISADGDVGIGTTAPLARLQTRGASDLSTAYAFMATQANGTSILAVRNDGNVGIGLGMIAPSVALQVAGNTVVGGVLASTGGLTVAGGISLLTGPVRIGSGVPPTQALDVTGNVQVSGTVTAASSRAGKADITYLTAQDYARIREALEVARPVTYRMKANDPFVSKPHLGIIAEEAPDWITTEDKTAISMTDYLGFLLAALKAQQEEIRQLKADVERLLADTHDAAP